MDNLWSIIVPAVIAAFLNRVFRTDVFIRCGGRRCVSVLRLVRLAAIAALWTFMLLEVRESAARIAIAGAVWLAAGLFLEWLLPQRGRAPQV